jgi:hypothetical protein
MFYFGLVLGIVLVGIGVATSPVRKEPVELRLQVEPPPG